MRATEMLSEGELAAIEARWLRRSGVALELERGGQQEVLFLPGCVDRQGADDVRRLLDEVRRLRGMVA